MTKKKKKKNVPTPKTNTFIVLTSEEATRMTMPKYNTHAIGHGAHGDCKYNRAKERRQFKRELAML